MIYLKYFRSENKSISYTKYQKYLLYIDMRVLNSDHRNSNKSVNYIMNDNGILSGTSFNFMNHCFEIDETIKLKTIKILKYDEDSDYEPIEDNNTQYLLFSMMQKIGYYVDKNGELVINSGEIEYSNI